MQMQFSQYNDAYIHLFVHHSTYTQLNLSVRKSFYEILWFDNCWYNIGWSFGRCVCVCVWHCNVYLITLFNFWFSRTLCRHAVFVFNQATGPEYIYRLRDDINRHIQKPDCCVLTHTALTTTGTICIHISFLPLNAGNQHKSC